MIVSNDYRFDKDSMNESRRERQGFKPKIIGKLNLFQQFFIARTLRPI